MCSCAASRKSAVINTRSPKGTGHEIGLLILYVFLWSLGEVKLQPRVGINLVVEDLRNPQYARVLSYSRKELFA